MTAIFDMLSPARAAGFVRANGLLGFEARQRGPRDFAVIEHRHDPVERVEVAYPAPSMAEACQTARRWAEVTDTEVLAVGRARCFLAELAPALRALRLPARPAGVAVQVEFSFCGEGVAA
jgi:hypothetical protein